LHHSDGSKRCVHARLSRDHSCIDLGPHARRRKSSFNSKLGAYSDLHVEEAVVVSPHTRKRNVLIRVGLSTDARTPSLITGEILTSAFFEHRERGQRVGEKYSLFDSVLNQRCWLAARTQSHEHTAWGERREHTNSFRSAERAWPCRTCLLLRHRRSWRTQSCFTSSCSIRFSTRRKRQSTKNSCSSGGCKQAHTHLCRRPTTCQLPLSTCRCPQPLLRLHLFQLHTTALALGHTLWWFWPTVFRHV
jgi:hypothetical protein